MKKIITLTTILVLLSVISALADNSPPYVTNLYPEENETVCADTEIYAEIYDDFSGVNPYSIRMWVNGEEVDPEIYPIGHHNSMGYAIYYEPEYLPEGAQITVSYYAEDFFENALDYTYSFFTEGGNSSEDMTPPEVVETHPEDGQENISPDTPITIYIIDPEDGEVDPSGVNPQSIELYVNGEQVEPIIIPDNYGVLVNYFNHPPFEEGSEVNVLVGACDNAGNCMEYDFSFTIEGGSNEDTMPPMVIRNYPEDGATDVDPDTFIMADLKDMPMFNNSGIDLESVEMYVNGDMVDAEVFHHQGAVRVLYNPEEPFENGSQVIVELNACDNAGNCMDTYTFSFTISEGTPDEDTLPPYVYSVYPEDGASDVPIDTDIRVVLIDQGPENNMSLIDPESIVLTINNENVEFVTLPIPVNGITVIWENDGRLLPNEEVTVSIDACDNAGNCMDTYSWSFSTETAEDTEPPVITDIHPEPNSTDVPANTDISFLLVDELSGVDENSITLTVNDVQITDFNIEVTNDGVFVSYQPPEPFEAGELVTVVTSFCDNAGNCADFDWSFEIENESEAPLLLYPLNGAWLNYFLENHAINFSWTADSPYESFRLKVVLDANPENPFYLDIGPGEYMFSFGVATIRYTIERTSWDVLSDLGFINWSMARIDEPGGVEISPYSEVFRFTLAPTDCVILRTPDDFSVIPENEPPVFSWDPDTTADHYLVGFARVGENGEFLEDIYSFEVPNYINQIPVSPSTWELVPNGYWLWTVLAIKPDGSYGNFMIFHFTKVPTGAEDKSYTFPNVF